MSGGLLRLPSFAQNDPKATGFGLLGFGGSQSMAGQGASAATQWSADQDTPPATPPGYSGFTPSNPPTGAPTSVMQPGAASFASAAVNALGPSSAQAATSDPGDIRGRFISTLQQGGLTNPNGLGAVAAYAQHESGYSPGNITGSWSDPSQSGAPGTSGGILSWRGDRLDSMRAFTQGAADPVTAQANFLLQENPQLTQSLQNARSPQEANTLMAQAWKFAGYNQPGGENAARLATTQAYANSFGGGQVLPGVSAPAGGTMGSTAQSGGFGPGGVQAQGASMPGQASPTAALASLSGQPMTAAAAPSDQPDGSGSQQNYATPSPSYAGVMAALRGATGGQARAQAQQQVQRDKDKGFKLMAPRQLRPVSLGQAQQMFDANRFYSMLPRGGRMG